MATIEELESICTEMENIQAHGEKPYDPKMSEAIQKLSKWNRDWAAQNKRKSGIPTVGCLKCGEHWPASYTHYVHICLMESHLTEESNHKEEKLDMVCSHESDGTVTDVSAMRNRDISHHDARTYQLRCKKCDEYYSLPKDSHLKDNSNDN